MSYRTPVVVRSGLGLRGPHRLWHADQRTCGDGGQQESARRIAMTLRSSLKERLRASREKPAPKPVPSRKALAPKPEWNVRPLSSERFSFEDNI